MSTTPTTKLMKAVLQREHNADFTQAVRFGDHPIPEPDAAKGQVRIRVVCGATNPVDVRFVNGDLASLLKQDLPTPIGRDFAGVVDTIPDKVANPQGLSPGDRVCGWLDHTYIQYGSFAEYLVCDIKVLAKIPNNIPFSDAVAVPLAGNTSYVALVDYFKLKPGCAKKILILGGSSATGIFAIQLAKHFGCSTIACTSTAVQLCTDLGATEVINYQQKQWWEAVKDRQFDFVYDTVGGKDSWDLVVEHKVLKKSGMYYTIVGDITSGKLTIGRLLGSMCGSLCRGCCGGPKYQRSPALPADAEHGLNFWLPLIATGTAKVVHDPSGPYTFNAADAAAMLTKQASGRCKGKLVMQVSSEVPAASI